MIKNFLPLLESEIEKAEITLAVRDISDRLQKMASDLSRTIVDDLPSVTERIKATHGINAGNDFGKKISEDLNTLVQSILETKSTIDDRSLVLSGDASETDVDVSNDMETDLGLDDEVDTDVDMGAEVEDDMFGDMDKPGAGKAADEPALGRSMKAESVKNPIVRKLIESAHPSRRKVIAEMYKRGGDSRKRVLELARKKFK